MFSTTALLSTGLQCPQMEPVEASLGWGGALAALLWKQALPAFKWIVLGPQDVDS